MTGRDQTRKKGTNSDRNQSKSIRRAFSIMDVLAVNRGMTPSEIARLTGTPKATVSRLLNVLVDMRYVQQDPQAGTYALGWRVVEMSSWVLNSTELRAKARLHLLLLMEQVQETVNLGILHDNEVMYIDRVDSVRTIRLYSALGKRIPAHCSALGKAILAFSDSDIVGKVIQDGELARRTKRTITNRDEFIGHLKTVRENGYAVDDEEHQDGVRCIAAPIFGHSGVVCGAVSVSGPTTRMDEDRLQSAIVGVRTTAREISLELGWQL